MLIWKIYIGEIKFENTDTIRWAINTIMICKEQDIYCFMFEILGIYLTIPFLSLVAKEENRKILWFTVLLYFIFNASLSKLLPLVGIKYNNSLTVQLPGYVIYVILGYLLSTKDLTKKQKIILYISAIIGVIFRYTVTFILSKQSGEVIKNTWGYTQWHCILLACAIFVFVKNLKIDEKLKNRQKIVRILSKVSGCSFGVFLIHKMVMHYELQFFNTNILDWKWRTIGVIITYLFSLIIIYILKKNPIIKRIVP